MKKFALAALSTVLLSSSVLHHNSLANAMGIHPESTPEAEVYANQHRDDRQLIVLSAPAADEPYYRDVYDQIIEFNIAYAKSIMGKDNVVVLGDKKALALFAKELPEDILLEAPMYDIWMRDPTTVNPHNPVQFRYAAAAQGGDQVAADEVQNKFIDFTDRLGIHYPGSDLILDGGNLVDNHKGRVIVSDRFLQDNGLSKTEGKAVLKELLAATEVAIIPSDDPEGLAHADGMVMFIEDNVLAINKYDGELSGLREEIFAELHASFPGIEILEIPVQFDDEVWDKDFASACGIYANALVTDQYVYMPVFGESLDSDVIDLVQANTSKVVVPINAESVCFMGGSARCLGWQISGTPAEKIITAARED